MIKLFFLFVSISSFAQSKVGTIDIDFIITKMPEITASGINESHPHDVTITKEAPNYSR